MSHLSHEVAVCCGVHVSHVLLALLNLAGTGAKYPNMSVCAHCVCVTLCVCACAHVYFWCVCLCGRAWVCMDNVYCNVLQCVAVCCSAVQCVAEHCSVLQCVAVCCSVLQCEIVCNTME